MIEDLKAHLHKEGYEFNIKPN